MTTATIDAVTIAEFPLTGAVTALCSSEDDTDQDYSRLRILIVDDSRFYRTVIMNALAPFRLTNVLEAVDGDDAFEALRTSDIDLLLVDFEMPGLNGAELVRQIRWSEDEKIDATVPIIMISNFTERAIVMAARNGDPSGNNPSATFGWSTGSSGSVALSVVPTSSSSVPSPSICSSALSSGLLNANFPFSRSAESAFS